MASGWTCRGCQKRVVAGEKLCDSCAPPGTRLCTTPGCSRYALTEKRVLCPPCDAERVRQGGAMHSEFNPRSKRVLDPFRGR